MEGFCGRLASYDVFHFPFNVWGLGNHLSLFTLTAAITKASWSHCTTWTWHLIRTTRHWNTCRTFPVHPAVRVQSFARGTYASIAVSNLITLILQFIIQNYIIDHDKIWLRYRRRTTPASPKSKSKWQNWLEQMQETQRQAQQQQAKGGRKITLCSVACFRHSSININILLKRPVSLVKIDRSFLF